MNNLFKFKESKIRFPLFETKEKAELCAEYSPMNAEIASIRSNPNYIDEWRHKYEKIIDDKILLTDRGDAYFIISKETIEQFNLYCFHVIAGEKVGWMTISKNIELDYL